MSAIMFSANANAQNLAELRHFTTPHYKMDFYISTIQKKINYTDTLDYHWYKAQKLHITQGGSAGDLLHGDFQKFHVGGQLAERGEFRYGLKDGEWLTWYESGAVKSKLNYNDGVLKGAFTTYSKEGEITEKGKFRKGLKKLQKPQKDKSSEERQESEELDPDNEEMPWYKKIFKFERKENPERDQKRLARRRRRQEKKMEKEREVKND
ncbi:MAG: hypothetical protein GQ574_22885 [Crocinitomix sp.]|nr:hypothetical protein [Crocinitomix sp.]